MNLTNNLFLLGLVLVVVGLFIGWTAKKSNLEGFNDVGQSDVQSDVQSDGQIQIVFKLKKPNGRYLSLCHNCLGDRKMIICERGVGVNFAKVPVSADAFYIMVETPLGMGYLKAGENSLLYVDRGKGSLFGVTYNQDYTVSLKVMMDDSGRVGYIQKCSWLDGGGISSPRETSVGCSSNLICVAGDTVCDENKYLVELIDNWTYN